MKKLILIIMMLSLMTSTFATSYISELESKTFRPTSSTFIAMGSSGRAIALREDSSFVNPSAHNKGFSLIIPQLELSISNLNYLVSTAKGAINRDANQLLDSLSIFSGSSYFAALQASGMVFINGFFLDCDARAGLYTDGESISASISIPIEAAISLGYSHSFEFENDYSLAIGGVSHFNYRAYTIPVDVSSFVDSYINRERLIDGLISGSNISFDLGATFYMPYGFSTALTVEDLALDIKFKDSFSNELWNISIPSSVCMSLGYKNKLGPLTIMGAIDLVDVFNIKNGSTLLYHLNFGGAVELWKNIGLYGGLKGGYPSFGLKLKLFFFECFLSYNISETSQYVGYNPKDNISLMIRLFF